MVTESGSIDSVEYVMYNYSVSDLNYSFVRYIFPIHRSDPIRSDPICPSNRIGSVSQEWEIGSVRFDLRCKSDRTDLDRCTRKSNRIGIGSGSDRDRPIWLGWVATLDQDMTTTHISSLKYTFCRAKPSSIPIGQPIGMVNDSAAPHFLEGPARLFD